MPASAAISFAKLAHVLRTTRIKCGNHKRLWGPMSTPDDDEDEEGEIAWLLRLAAAERRGYAAYWKWPLDRTFEEAQVARGLLRYLEQAEGLVINGFRSRGNDDPPDCEATLTDGGLMGIEVTELVD